MTDFAAEWESLPAQAPAAASAGPVVEIHGTSTSAAPPARDYGAEWDALPASAPAAPAPPKTSSMGAPAPPATSKPIDISQDDLLREAGRGIAEVGTHLAKSTAATVAQGLGNIYDVVRGGSMAPLSTGARMSDWVNSLGGAPQTYVGRYGNQALDYVGSLPMRFIGQPLGDLAERLGASPALSALASTAGAVAGPAALGRVARGATNVPRETSVPRVEPSSAAEGPSPGSVAGAGSGSGATGEPVQAGPAGGSPGGGGTNAPSGRGSAVPGVSAPASTPVPADLVGVARPVEQLPAAAQLSSSAREFFPAVKKSTVSGDLPEPIQAERAQVMRAVGIDPADGFREGALKGNPKTQASEIMTAQTPGPLGDVYQKKLADEQNALRGYAQEMKDAAGGTQSGPELPQEQAQYIRGQNIVKPLQMLDDFYNKKAADLYAQARAQAGDSAPVQMKNVDALLSDPKFQGSLSSSTEGQHFYNWLQQQSQAFKAGQFGGNTIAGAENFRQLLNDANPVMGRKIAQVKQALDSDVAEVGGADTFKAARAMWAQYQKTLGDPKGISSLLEDENGNRTVPLNQVPTKLASMPDLDQFNHIVGTLKGIRNIEGIDPSVADASTTALREIRQQFTENAVNAGNRESWNPRDFNKTLNANAYRMGQVFTPQELQRFRTLNDAGFVLENQARYPGAVVQGLSLAHRGAIQIGAGAAGAAAELAAGGGMTGGAAAGFVGNRMGAFLTDRMARARAKQIQQEMRSNAEKYFPGAGAP